MAEIPVVSPGTDGSALALTAAASGDTAKCGRGRVLIVNNTNGSSVTVTIAVPGNTATGEAVPDNAIAIANNTMVAIPLLELYRDPTTRQAAISWSATTGVTRAVVNTNL